MAAVAKDTGMHSDVCVPMETTWCYGIDILRDHAYVSNVLYSLLICVQKFSNFFYDCDTLILLLKLLLLLCARRTHVSFPFYITLKSCAHL